MSALSSPASMFTLRASSSSIQVLSALKIAVGLGAFIAPALFSQRAFGFYSKTTRQGVTGNSPASTTSRTVESTNEAETSIALRLYASREIVLGLLLRDGTAATVVRALQANVIADSLDVIGAALSFLEGTISTEIVTAVALVSGSSAAFSFYILNRA